MDVYGIETVVVVLHFIGLRGRAHRKSCTSYSKTLHKREKTMSNQTHKKIPPQKIVKQPQQLTRNRVRNRRLPQTLRKDHSEADLQMPIDMTVEEPRTGVVGAETDGDVVGRGTDVDDVPDDGVDVVGLGLARAADDVEVVLLGEGGWLVRSGFGVSEECFFGSEW